MRNIKLEISYDGTDFSGWQRQPKQRTVEGVITKALKRLTGEDVNLVGAGRTDAGVHAKGQVANFFTDLEIPPEKIPHAIRYMLPKDVSIKSSEEVPIDFHSRFSAKRKIYRYIVYNEKLPDALKRRYTKFFPYKMDFDLLEEVFSGFIGKHDFSSFMARGANDHNVYKEIFRSEVCKKGAEIHFVVEGDAFLRNMVRIMVGTACSIAAGRIAFENFPKMFEGLGREAAGPTFDSCGLYLEKVIY